MKRFPMIVCGLALIMIAGCTRESVRELHGSVFLQREDGQAVKIALARVYPLRESDVNEMATTAAKLQAGLTPQVDLAKTAAEQMAARAMAEEEPVARLLAEKKARVDELKRNGMGENVLRSYEHEVDVANLAYIEVRQAGLRDVLTRMDEHQRIKTAAAAAILTAATTPLRPVAVAALSDADGNFSLAVPADCTMVLVEAQALDGAVRMVWLVPVSELDFTKPFLFSEHNRQR